MDYSLASAVTILLFVSYYNSIISGANFLRDFGEFAGTMLIATVSLLILGGLIIGWLGVTV